MKVIETHDLTKKFKDLTAVDHISLEIEPGELYGFVGLNGAGKTTTIKTILGMIKPTAGTVSLFGKDISQGFDQWKDVGYLVETTHAYPNLSVRENLEVYYHSRKMTDRKSIDKIIERLRLSDYRHMMAKHLSLGNLQRLGLAKVLMQEPRLLLLDEPMNGLDPAGIIEVREMFKELTRQGTAIFISSHILSELARSATKIGMIHKGRLVKELESDQLEQQVLKCLRIESRNIVDTMELLKQNGIPSSVNSDKTIEVKDSRAIGEPEVICEWLVAAGLTPKSYYVFEEDLEAFFMRTIRGEEE